MIDQHIEVLFNREIIPGIFLMGLKSPQMASESMPGQFVMVRVSEGIDPLLRRPFSICDLSDKDTICILYKTVGHGTEILTGKKEGERLSVMGPLGRGFNLPDDNLNAVLVAGGIGVAPLYFLARSIKQNPMEFMAGFGSIKEIIPHEHITDQSLNISIATDDGSQGYSGMVTGLLDGYLEKKIKDNKKLIIYACGPLPMLKKISSIASDRNIPCQVSLESLMACGLGACQGCAVRMFSPDNQISYGHVCKDGPVFPSQAVDWSNT